MAKLHWTQTPAGRRRMRELGLARAGRKKASSGSKEEGKEVSAVEVTPAQRNADPVAVGELMDALWESMSLEHKIKAVKAVLTLVINPRF